MLQDLVDVYEIKGVIRVIESVYISHCEFYICDPPLGSDLTGFCKYIFFCIDADDLTLRSKLGKVGEVILDQRFAQSWRREPRARLGAHLLYHVLTSETDSPEVHAASNRKCADTNFNVPLLCGHGG